MGLIGQRIDPYFKIGILRHDFSISRWAGNEEILSKIWLENYPHLSQNCSKNSGSQPQILWFSFNFYDLKLPEFSEQFMVTVGRFSNQILDRISSFSAHVEMRSESGRKIHPHLNS